MFLIIIVRLFSLQVLSSKYKIMADDQGIFRKVVYPDRGLVFDRNKKPILQNTIIYDLMLTPNKLKGIDTTGVCNILGITTDQFNKKVVELIIKNGRARPGIFEPLLNEDKMAMLNESMYRFAPAFYLQERSVRSYPYDAAANVLGYLGEVDTNFLKKYPNDGYVPGDYAGMTGIERTYEKVLMGERGIEYWKRDNKNRLTEKWENGDFDTTAVAGQNLYTSIDIELQQLGEKLMQNKLGAVVALDPKTGGILAMVSAPTYQPSYLTGNQRRKHFSELFLNPALPLLNRTVSAEYPPGSTFKTLQALIGLHEGVIDTRFTVSCSGAFYGCGTGRPMKCLDYGTFDMQHAITLSDNTYFATVMQKVINNPKYPNIDSSLTVWNNYMYAFGLGKKLGVDVPAEKRGMIPTPEYYNKAFGKGKWNYCSFRSVSIGQGEVTTTPLQVANEMAYIANKGWFITPHVVDSIAGGDKFGILEQYRNRHEAMNIPDSIFEVVHNGMQGVIDRGTGAGARVKDIAICGKTGTVENYYRGVKQPNHSFFCAFAPRENPKIAIMCVVENSGRFGGTYAAPIVGLMIEKYLKDSIVDKGRLAQIDRMANLNLIPPRIYAEMRTQDSLRHSKDSAYLLSKGYIKIIKDTVGIEDDEVKKEDMKDVKKEKDDKKNLPNDTIVKVNAILPTEKRKPAVADTSNKTN
ncbi:MAG TPA: penicillin-binding transpeptidase domain-containing protein [Ferruginibacter sp.]|nr:penicillin-binding transpeptidase domain-containing protein [Ferruginibacter sp.]HRE63007.1 penicillin-binding transpeptidase domain-containing protein [Ferruginibacter sp.]